MDARKHCGCGARAWRLKASSRPQKYVDHNTKAHLIPIFRAGLTITGRPFTQGGGPTKTYPQFTIYDSMSLDNVSFGAA